MKLSSAPPILQHGGRGGSDWDLPILILTLSKKWKNCPNYVKGGGIVMPCRKGVFFLGYIPQAGRGPQNSGRNQGTLQAIFWLSSETKYTTGLKLIQKLDQGALCMSDPCGTLPLWPLNPMQCPGLTVSFPTFTFVLIDLLSLVKW